MSKKHFERLARGLAQIRPVPWPQAGLHAYNVWLNCCKEVGEVCKQTNPKFDEDRFIETCKTYKPIEEQTR